MASDRYRADPDDPDRFTTVIWNSDLGEVCLCTTYDIEWGYDSMNERDNDTKLFTCTKIDNTKLLTDGIVKPIRVDLKIPTRMNSIKFLVPKHCNFKNWVPKDLNNVQVFKSDSFQREIKTLIVDHMIKVERDLQQSQSYTQVCSLKYEVYVLYYSNYRYFS